MVNWNFRQRCSISSNASSLAHSPQKCGGHRLSGSFGVRLFVIDPKVFGVNAQKKLRNTLSRKARLNINDSAVIQHLTVHSVMQLAICPLPKGRSAMRHFSQTPASEKPASHKARSFKYVRFFQESTGSYKRYKSNVLAVRSAGTNDTLNVIKNVVEVIRG